MGKEEKNDRIEISEMFMAQADAERCFYGIIKRSKDANGNAHLFSRIKIYDGLIHACAGDQRELGTMLDQMCIMVLDMGLHNGSGIYIEIIDAKYFLN